MPAKIFSASLFGFECKLVEVEVDILNGISCINIVGLGDTSVQESKERIRCAIKNSGFEYPRRKKTINLAPANLRKHGPLFDLPIALGLLVKSEQLKQEILDDTLIVGELALNGNVRKVSGILAITDFAHKYGFKKIIVPAENFYEAKTVDGITILPAYSLQQIVHDLESGTITPPPPQTDHINDKEYAAWSFADIVGQTHAKRALTIAAAGCHNVLLYGPPGSGKTMLARAFQNILPPLTFDESLEVTKLHSIAGRLDPGESLIREPPFRAVHHTASMISLIGGGTIPRPGEISLAHCGVLFMDELLEFSRSTLDCLRQPLEDGHVTVTRVAGQARFPANFILIAATNPCPCGYEGDGEKECTCTEANVRAYRKKLSGPLLDRIDMAVYVPRTAQHGENTQEIDLRSALCKAREVQYERLKSMNEKPAANGRLTSAKLKTLCTLSPKAQILLQDAFKRLCLSGRAYYRLIKMAQTIADLEGAPIIKEAHLGEALQYRTFDV